MGYPELIQQRLQALPLEKQAEVLDFVEFLAGRVSEKDSLDDAQRRANVAATLRTARAAWPAVNPEELDQQFAEMRHEWDQRGWESKT